MKKPRMSDADMWGISEGWGLVHVCVCVGGGGEGGGRGVLVVQLEEVQSRATGFITGTIELPAAPAR